jgi:hypothetical protein
LIDDTQERDELNNNMTDAELRDMTPLCWRRIDASWLARIAELCKDQQKAALLALINNIDADMQNTLLDDMAAKEARTRSLPNKINANVPMFDHCWARWHR